MKEKILLVAFCGTSAELLLEQREDWKKLFLPNDKIKDSEILIDTLFKEKFDYVICFGQKPLIKNKISIEVTAREGESEINTAFDCEKMRKLFEQIGIDSKLSHNAGTSFCNKLYYNGLKSIVQNNMETQMVFIHIPFTVNITEFNCFCKKIFSVLESYASYGETGNK